MTRLFAAALFATVLSAQIEQGSFVGVVTDPQKSPVAGAALDFLNVATNVKRSTVTNGIFARRPADILLLGTAAGVKTLKRPA